MFPPNGCYASPKSFRPRPPPCVQLVQSGTNNATNPERLYADHDTIFDISYMIFDSDPDLNFTLFPLVKLMKEKTESMTIFFFSLSLYNK